MPQKYVILWQHTNKLCGAVSQRSLLQRHSMSSRESNLISNDPDLEQTFLKDCIKVSPIQGC